MSFDYEGMLARAPESLKRAISWQTAGAGPGGKILFGCGVATRCGEEAAAIFPLRSARPSRALVVTGRNVASLGIAGLVGASLRSSGLEVEVFGDVPPEPPVETADAVAAILKEGAFDVAVGVGGGSALDTARAAAALVTNPGSIADYAPGGPRRFSRPGLPTIMVPTTSGSGSEVSPFFVFVGGGRKWSSGHPLLFANVAIIDPLLTVTMPPRVTAGTGLDALTHAVESLIHTKSYPLGDALSLKAVEYAFRYLPRAVDRGDDIEARYYMSWASAMGMMSYAWTGGLYAHSISYVLTGHLGMPHGEGCGVSLPYTLMFNLDRVRAKLEYVAASIDLATGSGVSRGPDAALGAVRRTLDLVVRVGMPRALKDAGMDASDIEAFAKELVEKYPRPLNPRPMGIEQAVGLFESMWAGELRPLE